MEKFLQEQSLRKPGDRSLPLHAAVPCYKRASAVENYGERAEDADMLENAEDDGWVAPAANTRDAGEAEELPSSSAAAQPAHAPPGRAGVGAAEDDDEEDIPDIDDLELEDHEDEDDEVGASLACLGSRAGSARLIVQDDVMPPWYCME
jgi:hypothetical protein